MMCLALLAGTGGAREIRGHLETEHLPEYLRDRGEGVPASMFGTYIQKSQLIVYLYFEYYHDNNFEYAPNELGQTLDRDFRGDYAGYEGLVFLGYGLTDRLALEIEAAAIKAELKTAPEDRTPLPDRIEESGIGDVESQLRWRWFEETADRPELFTYFETVFPTQDEGSLIGTTDWELQLGSGVVRGYSWGTVTGRVAVEYDRAEDLFELGEYAVEYLKRLSSSWRVFGSVEGSGDEVELITEAQWHLSRHAFVKLNNAFGLTSKAPGWAPEVGVLLSF